MALSRADRNGKKLGRGEEIMKKNALSKLIIEKPRMELIAVPKTLVKSGVALFVMEHDTALLIVPMTPEAAHELGKRLVSWAKNRRQE